MAIVKEYAEELRESLSGAAFKDQDQFRKEVEPDLRAGYFAEVEHVGKSIFGRNFKVRK